MDFDLLADEVDLALALFFGVVFGVEVLDCDLDARFELVFEESDLDFVAVDAFGDLTAVFFCEDFVVGFLAGVFLAADFLAFGAAVFVEEALVTRSGLDDSEVFFLDSEVAFLLAFFAAGLFAAVFVALDLAARDEALAFEGVFRAGAFLVGAVREDFAALASSSETSTYSLRISNALNALSIAATTLRAVGRRFVDDLRVSVPVFEGGRFVEALVVAALLADDSCLLTLETDLLAVAFLVGVLAVLATDDVLLGVFFFVALGVAFFVAATAFLDFLIEPSLTELLALDALTLAAGFLATCLALVFAAFVRTDFAEDLADFVAVLLVVDFLDPFFEDFVDIVFAGGLAVLLADRDFPFFTLLVVLVALLPVEVLGPVSESLEVFCVSAGNVIKRI